MFRILIFLVTIQSSLLATDKIETILVTIPVFHTDDEGEVKMAKIPHTGWDIDLPFWCCEFYSSPIIVFKNDENNEQDINIISAYNVSVDYTHGNKASIITVCSGDAKKPVESRYSIAEVVEFTIKAIRQDFPNKEKFIIKKSNKKMENKSQ